MPSICWLQLLVWLKSFLICSNCHERHVLYKWLFLKRWSKSKLPRSLMSFRTAMKPLVWRLNIIQWGGNLYSQELFYSRISAVPESYFTLQWCGFYQIFSCCHGMVAPTLIILTWKGFAVSALFSFSLLYQVHLCCSPSMIVLVFQVSPRKVTVCCLPTKYLNIEDVLRTVSAEVDFQQLGLKTFWVLSWAESKNGHRPLMMFCSSFGSACIKPRPNPQWT